MEIDLTKIENETNRQYVKEFVRIMKVRGLSERRIKDCYMRLRTILNRYVKDKDFKKLSKKDFEDLSIELQKTLKSWHSLSSYISTVKVFARFLENKKSNQNLPDKYYGLEVPKNKAKYKKFKGIESIIDPEEAFKFVNNAQTKRDAFIFMVLFDAGLRPHELMKAKRKHLQVNDKINPPHYYFLVPEGTKTGMRKVRLWFSIPFVDNYLTTLPEDPETPLCGIGGESIIRIVKYVTKNKITPYCLRHSSISFWGPHLPTSVVCQRYGWTQGTKQLRTYMHISQKQEDDSMNKAVKIETGEDVLDKLKPKFCTNCNHYNNYNETNCRYCKLPLDIDERLKVERLNKIGYASAQKLIEIDKKTFLEIARSYDVIIT
ncbi:MAG: hypothetical protein ABH849_00585 [Nanoarchaeota archaeon]